MEYAIAGLFGLLILFSVGCVVFILDALVRGHDLPTTQRAIEAVAGIIAEHAHGSVVYDLGAGRGTFVLRLGALRPDLRLTGIDKGWVRVLAARTKARFLKRNVRFTRDDILRADLRDADVVYTYLWYSIMPKLERKLRSELKPGAIVITNTSYFPTWQLLATVNTWPEHEDFEKLFVYQVPGAGRESRTPTG